MSYDPNSPETRKGKLGEEIVRRFYDERAAVAHRPDGIADDEASLIDFHVEPYGNSVIEEHLAEVKVRNVMQYAFGRFPCYTIPVSQVELYKQFASERNLPLVLWIVDPKEGKMYSGELAPWGLENKVTIDGKEFPFDQQTKCGNMRFYHRKQFVEYPIDERDLRKFQEIEEEYGATEARTPPVADNPAAGQQSLFTKPDKPKDSIPKLAVHETFVAPNGTKIDLTAYDECADYFVDWERLGQALGYAKAPSISSQVIATALGNDLQLILLTTKNMYRGKLRDAVRPHLVWGDVETFIERYISATYGARQGSKRYNNHMEATRLLAWWKNVVLEGDT